LPKKRGELNIVFKPNNFSAANFFNLRFSNPSVDDILCSKTDPTSECVVDSSKGVFNISKGDIRQKPTKVRVYSYEEGCGYNKAIERALHTPGTHLAHSLY